MSTAHHLAESPDASHRDDPPRDAIEPAAALPADRSAGLGRMRTVLRELLLTVGAVLGTLCLLSALAALLFGITPLVFQSGSMGPAIETGALGIARDIPAADAQPGDVVSVELPTGVRITHRVVSSTPVGGDRVSLVLRGDANAVDDAEPYVVDRVDLLLTSVNRVGYVVSALASPPALFLGGLLAGLLLMVAFAPTRAARPAATQEAGTAPRRRHRHAAGGALGLTAVLLAGAGVVAPPPVGTTAAFTDTALATTTAATGALPVPSITGCTTNFGEVTVTYTVPTASITPSGIVATYGSGASTTSTAPIAPPVGAAVGTISFTPASTLLAVGTTMPLTVSTVLTGTTWRGTSPSYTVTTTLGLGAIVLRTCARTTP
ncbi:signal peptidase I [Rathayibacter festucae]|uniref:signal peptidase I n=1 Tax=Rathayibacter festucae TaxID=110937 RepID=UPI002A6B859B|nr:signal peptidase I [Rathayibacter festucae]MDY0914862.1 signal peptidase I [Rathayibacter festucae]